MNLPRTVEGRAVWSLAQRLGGQVRLVAGAAGGAAVLGWDMTAALTMAEALGVDRRAAAELLPVLEAVMVRRLNAQMEGETEPQTG